MDNLKEIMLKIICNKIKMAVLAKFLSIEEYRSDILEDFSEVQREGVETLYEKYLIYYGKPDIKFEVDSKENIMDILEETIELEKTFAKRIGANFGIRQSVIHNLAEDEKYYYHLKKLLSKDLQE